ncbi:COLGALT1 [Symbiodinium sp. CCMP2592]|nr:COLGALT1 [Symbiodinium sp. CCMP2592]
MLEGRFLVEVTQKSWYSGPKHFKTRKVTELHNLAAKRGHGEQVLLLFNGGEPGAPPLETGFNMPSFKVLYFSERTIGKVPESLEAARREAEVAREVARREAEVARVQAEVAREVARREAEVARVQAEVAREVARSEALQRELNELKATRTPLPFASVWAVLVVVAGVALASLYVGAANQLQS